MSHENLEAVREVIAAVNDRDLDRYLVHCTESIELETPWSAVEGVYEGPDAIRRLFSDLRDTLVAENDQVNWEVFDAPGGAGPYGITATPDGTPLSGVITISGTPGAYTGSIDAGDLGNFPIKGVTVSDQTMTINAEHPEGPLAVRLTFVADAFTGSWQLGTDTGEMVGKRKR